MGMFHRAVIEESTEILPIVAAFIFFDNGAVRCLVFSYH